MAAASISGFGVAVPAPVRQTELWDGFFTGHYGGNPVAERMFRAVGIETRHGVVNPVIEDVSDWSTPDRMRRYVTEALPLGKGAVGTALAEAGVEPDQLGMLIVASCTGYATPGLNVLLARDLGMGADLRSLLLGHMGCYASLPGLAAAADYVHRQDRPALLLCLELTSLHLQPSHLPGYALTPESVQQMIVHALFGDAAAAVVLTPQAEPGGLEVIDTVAVTDTTAADMMTWDIGDRGFRMGLSPDVPKVLGRQVGPAVDALLHAHDLTRADVGGWALHPGGPAILETVADALDLTEQQVEPSREILRRYGNCSSPTVLIILEQVAQGLSSGEHAVVLAFGPGLTLYATLLRSR